MMQLSVDQEQLNDIGYVQKLVNAIMTQRLIEGIGQKYDKAFKFYNGEEPTTKFEDSSYQCKVVNFTKPIVEIATKTFIGELPDIVTSGKKAEKDKISVFVQKLYNRQYGTHLYETCHYGSNAELVFCLYTIRKVIHSQDLGN